jgi:hypothetical protein
MYLDRIALAFALIAFSGCVDDRPFLAIGVAPPKRPPARVAGGFSIEIPKVTLLPGEEKSPCFIFPIELEGPSHFVGGGSLLTGPGTHHGNITTRPKTGEGIRPCPEDEDVLGNEAGDVVKGGTVLFASSTQIEGEEWLTFPEGMAFRIKDDFEIVARMHYLNPTLSPITTAPVYRWYTIEKEAVTQEVGPFLWIRSAFEIPPLSAHTASAKCPIPAPMHVSMLLPHMHRLGTSVEAWISGGPRDGHLFLQSRGYDPDNGVIRQYDPAVDLSQGNGVGFSCSWTNTLNRTIVEGLGDNEMCMIFGYAWPPENAFSAKATADDACVYLAPPPP